MINRTPIYRALLEYAQKDYMRLHMPGHIGQADYLVKELQQVALIDVTEVPGIDDLHLPVSEILEGEKLLAEAFKADKSMFLVNGATSGIHALFLALAKEGKKVIIPRNAHRSFYGGLVLSGLWPEYVPCEVEPDTGIALSVTPHSVTSALQEKDEIIGVFLTSPSFYGTTLKIQE
ncbi:MAG: aminotransferase class I/II-fold pyridoxal phosphate-dependent enzyme, partial [Syntrophomonadaceae bacterium]|nr:aminotransferase class I/II-fold pyridoxal phosphate-dependent enzyme [Syntrophomonadaceae bacterium]